jgi:PAS domain S-box-containing protein
VNPTTTKDTAAIPSGELELLRARLERATAENRALDSMIEERTRSLYIAQEELRASKRHLENILGSIRAAVIITDGDRVITSVGGVTASLTGWTESELVGRPLRNVLRGDPERGPDDGPATDPDDADAIRDDLFEGELGRPGCDPVPVLVACSSLVDEQGRPLGLVFAATDISERKRLEEELQHAQRLESIGELAAGVAHEINTPIQFVSDSVQFLVDALGEVLDVLERHGPLRRQAVAANPELAALVDTIEALEADVGLDDLRVEIPSAAELTLGGLDRISTIVKALKRFAHPGDERIPLDINEVIDSAVIVARSEYKYVADLELDLGPVEPVPGNPGDLGQVIVNLVVNAAHAIDDRPNQPVPPPGRITVATRNDDGGVRIDIADNGGGIPDEVRERIFDPFFTTKAEGRGTGQGLALIHNTIVTRHHGRVWFDTTVGQGTTFHVWLPGDTR